MEKLPHWMKWQGENQIQTIALLCKPWVSLRSGKWDTHLGIGKAPKGETSKVGDKSPSKLVMKPWVMPDPLKATASSKGAQSPRLQISPRINSIHLKGLWRNDNPWSEGPNHVSRFQTWLLQTPHTSSFPSYQGDLRVMRLSEYTVPRLPLQIEMFRIGIALANISTTLRHVNENTCNKDSNRECRAGQLTLARMKIYELRIYFFFKTETLGLDKDSVGWFFRGLSTKLEGYFQHPIQQLPRAKKENEGSHQGNWKLRLKIQKSILRGKSQPWRL